MRRRAADARTAAYRILEDVEAGAFADHAAERRLRRLDRRDRAFALELAYGCLRLRGRLDFEIATFARRSPDRLDLPVRLWLRIGLYQIRYLRVPPHAAVHTTVEGTRRMAGRPAGSFVNAVLRAALREGGEVRFPALAEDPIGHLTTWGSHPEWLVRRWLERWPVEVVARLVELDNRPPAVVLRFPTPERWRNLGEKFDGTGGRLEPLADWPSSCRFLGGDPAPLLGRVPAIVQDPAASAVVDYAGPGLEGPLVELCSAPGGKAVGLRWRAPGATPHLAADLSPRRLLQLRETSRRVGVDLLLAAMDGLYPAVRRARTVFLDVPCTGTGVLRRRADARWRLGPGRLAALVELQKGLLEAASALLAVGGRLIYSTCSLEPEENEEQVSGFLARHPEFRREEPQADSELPPDLVNERGELRVWPWVRETDGAFAVRLLRLA